jgi:membrane protein DedA with SNARE-associated domain
MEPAGCIGLFVAVMVTWIGISGPGEAALVSAGAVAARGEEQIVAVLAIAFAGTVAGSLMAYCVGRVGGRRLLLKPGPLLRFRAKALARSEALAQRRPFFASLLAPGWFAGINEVPHRPFALGAGLAGLSWTLTVGLGTFLVGPSLAGLYEGAAKWLAIAAIAGAIGVALFRLIRRVRPRSSRSIRGAGRAGARWHHVSPLLSPDQR